MATIWWMEVSAALARLGHAVDVALRRPLFRGLRRLRTSDEGEEAPFRLVPLREARWSEYDVVNTHAHEGFRTLERYGGAESPFIVATLGPLVAAEDRDGIHFFGRRRRRLFRVQERIAAACRHVTVPTEEALALWRACFGDAGDPLLVPGAAPARIPPPRRDPYPDDAPRCVFAGNFYTRARHSQPEAHRTITRKLNELGALLRRQGARLYVVGTGDARSLDPDRVTYLGAAAYRESWDYLHFADVGIVVAAGPMQNAESTKIYHYLRAGLPVIGERGFPNDDVVRNAGGGFVVSGGPEAMAEAVAQARRTDWDRGGMIRYIERHHTWDRRAEVYDQVIQRGFDG